MFRRVLAFTAFAAVIVALVPVTSYAASKEILELQREVAQLQDQIKQLQQNQDRQLAEIRTLVQQSFNAANEANKSVAVIQDGFSRSIREQEAKVVTPVVSLGTRMDQVSSDMRTVQQAIGDLTSMMSKMQAQLNDLGNAVKVMQAPAPPPPGAGGAPAGPGASGGAPSSEAPSITARDLYDNANRDRQGGKFELALQEFSDYLNWYGNTDLAPNAQYYIAWIHASQGDYDTAVKEYDMVLEKYPDNNKTPDALYGKGVALTKMGRRTDGAKEFQELIKRFPSNGLASQACSQLTTMGLKCNGPRAAVPAGKRSSSRK
jgi:tol-pal system protein YbgF